jgi:hypothetical protein
MQQTALIRSPSIARAKMGVSSTQHSLFVVATLSGELAGGMGTTQAQWSASKSVESHSQAWDRHNYAGGLMKKILLASVVFVTLAVPAVAADIRVLAYRPPPPPPVYIFNWTGCYAGGNVGYLWVEKDFTFLNRPIGQRERQQRGRGPASWLQLSVCGRMGGWHPG